MPSQFNEKRERSTVHSKANQSCIIKCLWSYIYTGVLYWSPNWPKIWCDVRAQAMLILLKRVLFAACFLHDELTAVIFNWDHQVNEELTITTALRMLRAMNCKRDVVVTKRWKSGVKQVGASKQVLRMLFLDNQIFFCPWLGQSLFLMPPLGRVTGHLLPLLAFAQAVAGLHENLWWCMDHSTSCCLDFTIGCLGRNIL